MCWSATGCSPRLFFAVCKLLWHWVPTDWTLGDRIALVIKDAVIAILPAVLAICIVAAQRLDPTMFVGRMPKPNSAVDINNRFILNTFEQFILYFIGNAGLGALLPAGRGAHADYSHRSVPDGTRAVLGRLSLQSLFARLRLRHHLLSDGRGLSLAHSATWCSGSTSDL